MSDNTSEIVDLSQVQAILGKSKKTIGRWIRKGLLSAPTKVGRRVFWSRKALEADIARLGLKVKEPVVAASAGQLLTGGAA